MDDTPWHALDVVEALRLVGGGYDGLTEAQIAARRYVQPNGDLERDQSRSRLSLLRSQVANLPTALLLGSSALSAVVRDWLDTAAVLSAVSLNAEIGYRIEHKNEDLLASWRRLEVGEVQVVRQGELRDLPVSELVRGDVIVCRAGDFVPADARIIDAHRLRCDEARLTGESQAQAKGAEMVPGGAPLAERRSMLYAGTAVVGGHGRAVVIAVGAETEAGRIGQLLAREEAPETPRERRLREFGNGVAAAALGAGVAAAVAGAGQAREAPSFSVRCRGVASRADDLACRLRDDRDAQTRFTLSSPAATGLEDQTIIIRAGAPPPGSALLQDEPSIGFLNLLANRHFSRENRMEPRGTEPSVELHLADVGRDAQRRLGRSLHVV